jgi:hypothetical protein
MVLAGMMDITHVQKRGYIQVFRSPMGRILLKKISDCIDRCALIGTVKECSYSATKNLHLEDHRVPGRKIKDSGDTDWWQPGPDAGCSSGASYWDFGSEWALELMFPDQATVSFCKRTLYLGFTLVHLPRDGDCLKGRFFEKKKRH